MRGLKELPQNYECKANIASPQIKRFVYTWFSLGMFIAFATVPHFFRGNSFKKELLSDGNFWLFVGKEFLVFMVLLIVYSIIYELFAGAFMKLCGAEKIRFSFKKCVFSVGSEMYFTKSTCKAAVLIVTVFSGLIMLLPFFLLPHYLSYTIAALHVFNIVKAAIGVLSINISNDDILIKSDSETYTVCAEKNQDK